MHNLGIGKHILLFIGIPLFGLSGLFSQTSSTTLEDKVDPFEVNRIIFDNFNYIKGSDWVKDEEAAMARFVKEVNTKGFDFKEINPRKIRIAHNYIEVNPSMPFTYYQTESGKEWMYWVRHEEPDSIQAERKRMAKYPLSTIGGNSSFNQSKAFSFYITYNTGDNNASINSYFVTPHHIMRTGFELDFPIPEGVNDLSQDKNAEILERFKDLLKVTQSLANQLVPDSEWIKKPLNGKALSAEQRLYGFVQFWNEVKYNFAFFDQVPDLDWDGLLYEYLPIIQANQSNDDYYRTLKLICAKLKDGHTNIYPPASLSLYSDAPAIGLKNFDKKAFVVNTTETFEGEIPLGSELIRVNDVPTAKYLEQEIFPYISSSTEHILYDWGIRDMLDGKTGTEVKLELKKPNGELTKLSMKRDRINAGTWLKSNKRRGLFEYEKKEGEIAYVSLNGFGNDRIIKEFEKYVDSIKDCRGVIIDLRYNGGGSSSIAYAILNHFTKKPYKGSASRTRSHMASHKAWGQFVDKDTPLEELSEFDQTSRLTAEGNYWHEFEVSEITPDVKSIIELPLVVLIGHNTASAAEDFLVALDQIGIAKVIGSPSFGSTGQPLMMDMPGGGRARICTKRDTYPDGREFVGYGIHPDFKVAQNVEDYLADNDVVLKYAIKYMKEHPEYSSDKK